MSTEDKGNGENERKRQRDVEGETQKPWQKKMRNELRERRKRCGFVPGTSSCLSGFLHSSNSSGCTWGKTWGKIYGDKEDKAIFEVNSLTTDQSEDCRFLQKVSSGPVQTYLHKQTEKLIFHTVWKSKWISLWNLLADVRNFFFFCS